MKTPPCLYIIFLAVDWKLFNRREMIKALAETVKKHGSTVIAVNRPLCPFTTLFTKRERFKGLFGPEKFEKLDDNLLLFSPRYFLHDHITEKIGFFEKLNIKRLQKSFRELFQELNIEEKRPVVWYYYPQQGYVSEIFPDRFLIYELKDALADFRGRENPGMVALEKKQKGQVDLFLSVVPYLYDKHSPGYKNSYLFGNGLSRKTFEALRQIPVRSCYESDRPQIGYTGMVSERIAWDLIKDIARQKPEWDFIFHGLIADVSIPGRFDDISNIKFAGLFMQEELPSIMGKFDIGILPYLENDFFRHTHPLKFFEYIAAGLPVVSSRNDELGKFPGEIIRIPDYNASSWIASIEQQLSADRNELKKIGLQTAGQFVWENMCEKLVEKISELYS